MPAGVIHPEGRISDGLQSKRGKQKSRIGGAARLRNKKRVVVAVIKVHHLRIRDRIIQVNIRGQNIDGRRRHFPDGKHIVRRAAALVRPGSPRLERVAQRRIHVHRQRISRFTRCGNLPYVFGHRPGVEIHVRLGAKRGLPTRRRRSGRHSHCAQDIRGHRRLKQFLRCRRIIALASPRSRLVLHLNHDHGALKIGSLEVFHESRKRGLVGFERRRRERRRRVRQIAVLVHHMRITLGVELHPLWHVVLAAVLPRPKPQNHQPHVMLAGLGQKQVDDAIVVLTLLRLKLLPVDRRFHGIDVEELHRRPDLGQRGRPGAGVMHLRAQHQVGSAVHEKGVAPVFLHDLRNGRLLNFGASVDNESCGNRSHQNSTIYFHLTRILRRDSIPYRSRVGFYQSQPARTAYSIFFKVPRGFPCDCESFSGFFLYCS